VTTSPKFEFTRLVEGSAGAEVLVNDAQNKIDAVSGMSVISRDVATPPGSPVEGDAYIVAASPTGAWTGLAGKIVIYYSGWITLTPWRGMVVHINSEDVVAFYTGSKWAGLRGSGFMYNMHAGTAVGQRWHVPQNGGTALGTGALTADRLYAIPFILPRGGTADQIACEVTTLAASSNVRMGIYTATADNDVRPGTLVSGSDVGAISSASTGVKSNTFSSAIRISPGRLYFLSVISSHNPTLRTIAAAAATPLLGLGSTFGATGFGCGWVVSQAYGALPSTFPSVASGDIALSTGVLPAVGLSLTA
jgi:hypothetical protein